MCSEGSDNINNSIKLEYNDLRHTFHFKVSNDISLSNGMPNLRFMCVLHNAIPDVSVDSVHNSFISLDSTWTIKNIESNVSSVSFYSFSQVNIIKLLRLIIILCM